MCILVTRNVIQNWEHTTKWSATMPIVDELNTTTGM
jgi:hypothetical protein